MPELPEVETIRRGLGNFILNKKIVQVKVDCEKSFLGGQEQVQGATIIGLRRRGKALLIDLDNGMTMMIHLRMTGQLIWRDNFLSKQKSVSEMPIKGQKSPLVSSREEYDGYMRHQFAAGHPSKNFTDELPNKQTRVNFVFSDGNLYFNDQRKFGFIKVLPTTEVEQEDFIANLAKEPWEMTPGELFERCRRHAKAPIKAVLLDQKVIAGLGNIYADEALFYASVHPTTPAGLLSETEVETILEGAREVMNKSIESGGSTMATYIKPDGTTGDYLEQFAQVFHREGQPCRRCGTIIIKTRVAGRGTHTCPHCQQPKITEEPVSKMPAKATRRP